MTFCPRCGAEQAPGASFCERCGHRLSEEPASPAVVPTQAAAAAPPRRASRPLLAVAGVVVVAAAVAVLLILTRSSGSGDPARDDAAARPATSTAVPAPSATTVPTAETPSVTVNRPAPRPATASAAGTVARTCGRDGVGGDCHLSIRSRPTSGAGELDRLDEGDGLRLTCQVRGERVFSSALGASSTVWSRTTRGGYVSNVYVVGPRLNARRMTLRSC